MARINEADAKPLRLISPPAEYMILIWGIMFKGTSLSTSEVWEKLKMFMTDPVSRASVINYLKTLAFEGLLTFEEVSGKGGFRRIYTLKGTPEDFADQFSAMLKTQFLEAYLEPIAGQYP